MIRKTFGKSNNLQKESNGNNAKGNKGISLLVLIIILIIMLILATAVITMVINQDLFDNANDVVMKSDMMAMLNSQEARLSDLMHDKLGDKSKITEEDFADIVPEEYAQMGFIASKDGMIYAGDDEHVKELAIEMGYIIPGDVEIPDIEGIFVSNVTTNGARIEIGIEEKPGVKYTYKYSKDNGATWQSEVSYETIYQIKGMTENTTYEVKVEASSGNSKKESGVERLVTKELLLGTVEIREGNKAGDIYEEETWTNKDIYIAIHQSETGQTTYELTGANTSQEQTGETTISGQGKTELIVKTTDGTNTKTEIHKINIDKEAPTGNITASSTTNSIIVDIRNAVDNLSGIKNYKFYLNGVLKETKEGIEEDISYEYEGLLQGVEYEIRVEIEDIAGNIKEYSEVRDVSEITTEEDIKVEIEPTGWTNQNVKLTMTFPAVPGLIGQYSEDGISFKDVTEEGKSNVQVEYVGENRTIYVRYKDVNGQTGKIRSITITNIDKALPEIKQINPSKTEQTNENVEITIVMQDNLSGINGYMISQNGNLDVNSNGWETIDRTTEEISRKVEVRENGLYYIYVKDVAGNIKKESININNIDKVAPTVVIEPNGGEYVLPTGGEKATLKATVTVNDIGESGIKTDSLMYVWSTSESAPTTGYENFGSGAELTFEDATKGTWYLYVKAQDNAGNITSPDPIKSQAFVVNDEVSDANKITLTSDITGWTNGNVTVKITYGANLKYNQIAGIGGLTTPNATEIVVEKNATVYAEATDAAGNKVTASIDIGNIDKLIPQEITIDPNGKINTKEVEVNVQALDVEANAEYGMSGIDEIKYQWVLSKEKISEDDTTWDNAATVENGGTLTRNNTTEDVYLQIRVKDKAGNKVVVVSEVYEIDNTPPTTDAPVLESTTYIIKATLKQTDANSGINEESIKYAIKESGSDTWGEWIDAKSLTYEFLGIVSGKKYDVKTKVTDMAGNESESQVATITTEEMQPAEGNITIEIIPSTWTNEDVLVRVTYNKINGLIGQFSQDGQIWNDITPTSETENTQIYEIKISENKTVYARYRDEINQISEAKTATIANIDKDNPILRELNYSTLYWTDKDVVLTIKAIDELSGLSGYMLSTDANVTADTEGWQALEANTQEQSFEITVSENNTYYLYIKDVAGNIIKEEVNINYIDRTEPIIEKLEEVSSEDGVSTIEAVAKENEGYIGSYMFTKDANITEATTEGWTVYEEPQKTTTESFEVTENGTYYYYVKNLVGKIAKKEIVIDSIKEKYTVTFDKNYLEDIWTATTMLSRYGSQSSIGSKASITLGNEPTAQYGNHIKAVISDEFEHGGIYYVPFEKLTDGKTYTWSVYVKASSNKTGVLIGSEQGGWISNQTLTTEWKKYTHTFTAKTDENGYYSFVVYLNGDDKWNAGDELYIHSLELMEGTPTNTTQEYKAGDEYGTLPVLTRAGYNFDGWYTEPVGGTKVEETSIMPDRDITLYGRWRNYQHTVAYDANGGTGAPEPQIKSYGTSFYISSVKPVREGYTFKNWNTKADGTGTSYDSGAYYSRDQNGGTVTLYAQWEQTTFKITYNLDGGTDPGNPKEYRSDTELIELNAPVREGYAFVGWKESQDGIESKMELISYGQSANIVEEKGIYTMTHNVEGNIFNSVKIQIYDTNLNYIENISEHSTLGTYLETWECKLESGTYIMSISANGNRDDSPRAGYRVELEKGRKYQVGFTIDSFSATKAVASKFKFYREGGNVTSIPVDIIQKGDTGDKYFTALWEGLPMIQKWTRSSRTDFHSSIYKSKTTKIVFKDITDIPSTAIESWDVSQLKNGSVIAYVEDDGNNGYIVTIGGKGKVVANTDSSNLFYGFTALKEIENLKIFDTSNVTSMSSMFNGCRDLASLDVSGFDTSNVTSMSYMFNSCRVLASLDVSGFDTSNVTSMSFMFSDCRDLASLDVSGFDTSNVTDMSSMFNGCRDLTSLDVSKFDTSNVTSMSYMFSSCSGLTSLDVSGFDTSNVTDMRYMFYGCQVLASLDVSGFDTSKVTDMRYMFYQCHNLTTTLTIRNSNTSSYDSMFNWAAQNSPAKITVNYTIETSDLVDAMIATKSSNSNVVKGVEVPVLSTFSLMSLFNNDIVNNEEAPKIVASVNNDGNVYIKIEDYVGIKEIKIIDESGNILESIDVNGDIKYKNNVVLPSGNYKIEMINVEDDVSNINIDV